MFECVCVGCAVNGYERLWVRVSGWNDNRRRLVFANQSFGDDDDNPHLEVIIFCFFFGVSLLRFGFGDVDDETIN